MKIIEVVVATLDKNTDTPFTLKNLQQLARTCVGKLLSVDFDYGNVIGVIRRGVVTDDNELMVTIEIGMDITGLYIVPVYTISLFEYDKTNTPPSTMYDLNLICLSTTLSPEDKSLQKVSDKNLCSDDGVIMEKLVD